MADLGALTVISEADLIGEDQQMPVLPLRVLFGGVLGEASLEQAVGVALNADLDVMLEAHTRGDGRLPEPFGDVTGQMAVQVFGVDRIG